MNGGAFTTIYVKGCSYVSIFINTCSDNDFCFAVCGTVIGRGSGQTNNRQSLQVTWLKLLRWLD
jgi:hypothetical protein